ncbi:MAG: ATP-binding protein [Acidihalobacter sp.]
MTSLQTRLSVWLTGILLVLFALAWLVTDMAPQQLTQHYVTARLEHDGETLLAGLSRASDGKLGIAPRFVAPVYLRPFSGHYYVIRAGSDVLRSRSLWDYKLDAGPPPAGSSARLSRVTGPQNQHLLVWQRRVTLQGETVDLTVAENLSALDADIARFRRYLALFTVIALIAVLLLQRPVVRGVLRPLQAIRRQLGQLERGERDRLEEDAPREIRPLVHELNALLERLGARLERSRSATGNLAHALKTPLARLQQISEFESTALPPDVRGDLAQAIGDMRASIDRELKRARMAGGGVPGMRLRLDTELARLAEVMGRIHHDRTLEIETELPAGQTFSGDREDMLELFGNLLDNACKWARGRILLRVEADAAGALHAWVEDDGPGGDPQTLASLTERGARADEHVAGHGLGLAIVSDIVAQYDGRLAFGRSEALGGLSVEIDLPPGGRRSEAG